MVIIKIITILATLLFLAVLTFWLICKIGSKAEKEQNNCMDKRTDKNGMQNNKN